MKTPLIALAALTAFASTALAQGAMMTEVNDSTMIQPWNISANDAENMDVFGAQGLKIGEVEDVLGTSATEATMMVIDFAEMMNGDHQDRIVPLDALTLEGVNLTLAGDADLESFAVRADD